MWTPSILLLTLQLLAASRFVITPARTDYTTEEFWSLLDELKQQQHFSMLLLENCHLTSSKHIFVSEIWTRLQVSTLILSSAESHQLKLIYNDKLLALLCLEQPKTSANRTKAIHSLALKLQHMRQTRIILLLNITTKSTARQGSIVEGLLRQCLRLKMPNVIALLPNFAQSKTIFAFKIFPAFKLQRAQFIRGVNYFPDKVRDMRGQPLNTIPDQNIPRTYLYHDGAGQLRMTGYIAKLMQTFAQHHNATLVFPCAVEIGESIHVLHLQNYTRAGVIDVATGLGSFKLQQNIHEYTRVVEYSSWLLMLPMERELEVHELFLQIFRSDLLLYLIILSVLFSLLLHTFYRQRSKRLWYEVLFNDKSFRGALAQSFPMEPHNNLKVSWILSMIFLSGLIMNCLLSVYLKTFLTQPPTEPRIHNFDDLLDSGTKVLIFDTEFQRLCFSKGLPFLERYKDAFEVVSSWTEFVNRRISLDESHAYPVTAMLWRIIETRQSVFTRKLFRIEPSIYLEESIIFSLPVQENSIFMQALNQYIIYVQQAGLLQHWYTTTFHDLVAIGAMSMEDISAARHYEGIVCGDLYWVWIMLGVAFLLCIGIFCMELLVYKYQRWRLREPQSRVHRSMMRAI